MRTAAQRGVALAESAMAESMGVASAAADPLVAERIEALDWQRVAASLDTEGHAVMRSLLSPEERVWPLPRVTQSMRNFAAGS